MEAAFFDLDKTVIAKASMVAFGRPSTGRADLALAAAARLYGQLVYLYLGADEEQLRRMRESVLALTKGWDQADDQRDRPRDLDEVDRADRLRRGARPDPRAPGRGPAGVHRVGVTRGDRRAARRSTSASTRPSPRRAEIDDDGRYTGEASSTATARTRPRRCARSPSAERHRPRGVVRVLATRPPTSRCSRPSATRSP